MYLTSHSLRQIMPGRYPQMKNKEIIEKKDDWIVPFSIGCFFFICALIYLINILIGGIFNNPFTLLIAFTLLSLISFWISYKFKKRKIEDNKENSQDGVPPPEI